jgi:hypothetical protein
MKRLVSAIIVSLMISSLFSVVVPAFADTTESCDSCGMTVDATGQARFQITDTESHKYYACCPICALKIIKTEGDVNILSYCDYNGPDYPITINVRNQGSEVTITPTSALFINGGGCTKNRLVYDSAAADALLSPPNSGTSMWLSPLTNETVASNATRIAAFQAAVQYGGVASSPSPSPTATAAPTQTANPTQQPTQQPTSSATQQPTASVAPSQNPTSAPPTSTVAPTSTPAPSAIPGQAPQVPDQVCEPCEMTVTADDQWHFKVTDGTGQIHYVECFMCALNLIDNYDTLHIETFCDWYGPNYPITIDSTGRGAQVVIDPPGAMYLYTGACAGNRVAYNQTAADALKTDYSQYTSQFQAHAWANSPTVVTVLDGVNMNNQMSPEEVAKPTLTPILIGAVVVIVVVLVAVAFFKLRKRNP